MYIQPKREEATPPTLPKGYSGSAFLPSVMPPMPIEQEKVIEPPREAEAMSEDTKEALMPAISTTAREEKRSEENAPTGRFSLLSALLPPKRGKKEGGDLPEWVLIAAVFLLLFADGEKNDILPFLLLLLLWD